MNYAIEVLEEKLESELLVQTKVSEFFKQSIQEDIDDLKLVIHNLKMLENGFE